MAYGNPQRLYVLERADGVLKAGITCRSEQRVMEHKRSAQIVRHFITSGYVSGFDAETDLLARLSRIGTVVRGREWFVGVRFSDAVQIAQQVARQFVNPNPRRQDHKLRRVFAGLNFSDQEIKVLDAYCARAGVSRSAACRELALAAAVDMLTGGHEKNFAPRTT